LLAIGIVWALKHFELFDAVQITQLPDGRREIPAYYSATGVTHIKVGEIGVVLADWPGNTVRIEAVDANGQIAWQAHLDPAILQRLPPTAANYSRRRINAHWAMQHGLGDDLRDPDHNREALSFARKVMQFAAWNIDLLIERLLKSGYEFAHKTAFRRQVRADALQCFEELAAQDIFVPISLQAWCLEVGGVDLCGTHPAWPRTAYSGLGKCEEDGDPWYTDPLSIWFDPVEWLQACRDEEVESAQLLEIAPDEFHKANISGAGPICISAARPEFDPVLIGQSGSFTLLSYLRWAFEWGGFPGFEYIADAPKEMLAEWRQGLTRL
jgi:hypothetical protein